MKTKIEICNKKLHHNYFVEESYIAGIVLHGNEIRSIREGLMNISESFANIQRGEVWLINSTISEIKNNVSTGENSNRPKKLLLHKNEIKRISKSVEQLGYTLIPEKIFIERNMVKVILCLCKGKHEYDKRETIKQKDLEREYNRKF